MPDVELGAPQSADGSWTPKTPEPVFDLAALTRRCMNDKSLASMLVEKFTSRLNGSLLEIEQLITSADWPAAVQKVHDLKGEAGSMAAGGLHAASAELERCLRSAEYTSAPTNLARVKQEAARCREGASAALARLAPSVPAPSQIS